jgi:hypothetical protein
MNRLQIFNPASHGYVKFHLSQKKDLPWGTLIQNRAAIYFDYNPPIFTEVSWHTVDTIKYLVAATEPKAAADELHASFFKITPNPFFETTLIEISDKSIQFPVKMADYDLFGHEIRQETLFSNQYTLRRNNLQSGVYVLKLMDGRGKRGLQKLIVR